MAEVRIPNPKAPFVDPKTGIIARDWWRFLHDQLVRAGGTGDVDLQTAGDDLTAIEALSGTGDLHRVATNTWALRTLAGSGDGISVTNGDGVSGNPTVAVDADLEALVDLNSTAGLLGHSAANTWTERTITAGPAVFVTDGNGVSGNPTIEPAFQAFETTIGQAALASAGTVTVLSSGGSEQWKIRDILTEGGTNFSGGGGDRLMDISDGTTSWCLIAAAQVQTLATGRWGETALPFPATASNMSVASTAGTDITAAYSGGATDYTAGEITIIVIAERTA